MASACCQEVLKGHLPCLLEDLAMPARLPFLVCQPRAKTQPLKTKFRRPLWPAWLMHNLQPRSSPGPPSCMHLGALGGEHSAARSSIDLLQSPASGCLGPQSHPADGGRSLPCLAGSIAAQPVVNNHVNAAGGHL